MMLRPELVRDYKVPQYFELSLLREEKFRRFSRQLALG
jgi:hypothetical protein